MLGSGGRARTVSVACASEVNIPDSSTGGIFTQSDQATSTEK